MAREIVITSVPRGVKLGRTGFQVAMQTTGLRDDEAAVLEKMAGYRHLPVGSGANPVCYFHRLARTVAGPLNVVGRIVDAGVDFSNRSNKLAHMVVLEATDLGTVAVSSPATLLTSVDGRLAASWPGSPEERQQGFSLAGIPAAVPAPCGTWQQVMGDAGWAGVIADRAIRNQPTLLIGPDSSPAACSRMLALFREALAIVPPAKRWSVTFDTTTLSPEGVLWRGTYAGSPESQTTQPGLLVIDLARPQPIPANMAVSDLVQMARTGQAPVTLLPPVATTPRTDLPGVPGPGPTVPLPGGGPPAVPGGGPALPPPGSARGGIMAAESGKPRRSKTAVWLTLGILLPLFLVGILGLVAGIAVWPSLRSATALREVQQWAATDGNESAGKPTVATYHTLLRAAGPGRDQLVQGDVEFLNAALASKALTADDVMDADAVRKLLDAVSSIRATSGTGNAANILLLKVAANQQAADLLAAIHPGSFKSYQGLSKWADACNELVRLANANEADRNGGRLDDELWNRIVQAANAKAPEKDFADGGQEVFLGNLQPEDLTSLERLAEVLATVAPARKKPQASDQAAEKTPQEESTAKPMLAQPSPDKAAAAFTRWQTKLKEYRESGAATWPPREKPSDALDIMPLVPDLDVEVIVGTTPGFAPQAVKDGEKRTWKVMLEEICLAVVDLSADQLSFRRGEVADNIWKKYEPYLKYMPIAFHRPGKPVSEEDWLVLGSQNQEHTFSSNSTLYDLLWNENLDSRDVPAVTLVLNPPLPASGPIRWLPRKEVLRERPLTVRTVPISAEEISVEVTARIGDRDYTLREPLEVDVEGQKVRRKLPSWRDRKSRQLVFTENNADESTALGFKDGKSQEVDNKPATILKHNRNLPVIVGALLEDAYRDQKVPFNVSKSLMTKWKNSWEKSSFSVIGLREELEGYVSLRDGPFAASRFAENKSASPDNPGDFATQQPEKNNDETPEDFEDRKRKWEQERDKHAELKKKFDEWYAEGLDRIREQVKNPAELRKFLAESALKDDSLEAHDPYVSAAHVLLSLDGIVVAKVYRDKLEALFKRLPIAALFEGEVRYDWTVPGLETPVTTVAAWLRPAAINPDQADAQDPPDSL